MRDKGQGVGCSRIHKLLGIKENHILKIGQTSFKIIVDSKWLSSLVSAGCLPAACPSLPFSDVEIMAMMFRDKQALPDDFMLLEVDYMAKRKDLYVSSTPSVDLKKSDYFSRRVSEVIRAVDEENFRNLWNTANRRTLKHAYTHPENFQPFDTRLANVLSALYSCTRISLCNNPLVTPMARTGNPPSAAHPGLKPLWALIESEEEFLLISASVRHSLTHLTKFSPAIMLQSTARGLFIAYQLAELFAFAADAGIDLGELVLEDFRITVSLWILLCPRWDRSLLHNSISVTDYNVFCLAQSRRYPILPDGIENISLDEAMTSWVEGRLSNFDYLMLLNKLCGRCANNPYYHPVLPWVSDLSSADGIHYRDLSKSKFRLTRGDRQLDVTYESALNLAQQNLADAAVGCGQLERAVQVPHHISEILSDITYYVYKARRLSKEVLCTHVRPKWVPAEYPASVQRLQEWSPNESIPEFFTDATIFQSIHDDLPDLELPSWADGPEDFITKHMAILESSYVAEHLHHWIDITFGYKLTGAAAIKAKNVSLPLMDNHTHLLAGGVTQLFTVPHPPRERADVGSPPKISASLLARSPSQRQQRRGRSVHSNRQETSPVPCTKENVSAIQEGVIVEGGSSVASLASSDSQQVQHHQYSGAPSKRLFRASRSTSRESATLRPENLPINLPRDFHPLALLGQLEAYFIFRQRQLLSTKKSENRLISASIQQSVNRVDHVPARHDDILLLGCLLAELSLHSVYQAESSKLSLKQRTEYLRKAMLIVPPPRYFRALLRALLPLNGEFLPAVRERGLPPPSPSLLLSPHTGLIRFPPAFAHLYHFVAITLCPLSIDKLSSAGAHPDQIARISNHLPRLLPEINRESLDLVMQHLSPLFSQPGSCVLALWHLFEPLARALGPKEAVKAFLKHLIRAFDPDVATAKHIKLYHRSFLLQLMVRLGLQAFLQHFSTVLVEAVGGYRDFDEELDTIHATTASGSSSAIAASCTGAGEGVTTGFTHQQQQHHHAAVCQQESSLKTECGLFSNLATHSVANPVHSSSQAVAAAAAVCMATPHRCKLHKRHSHLDSSELEELESTLASVRYSHQGNEVKEKEDARSAHEALELVADSSDERERVSTCAINTTIDEEASSGAPLMGSEDLFIFEVNESEFLGTSDDPEQVESANRRDSSSAVASSVSFSQSSISLAASAEVSSITIESAVHDIRQSLLSTVDVDETSNATPASYYKKKIPLKEINSSSYNISDVASESIVWLAHRLGPVLTARHLSRNLLRMLTLCYRGCEQMEFTEPLYKDRSDYVVNLSQTYIVGDVSAMKALSTLCDIAFLYGEHFVTRQYIQYVADLVEICRKRMTDTLEGALLGGITLLKHVIPLLTDAALMNHLQSTIVRGIIYPTIQVVSSLHHTFPNGALSRRLITYRIADVLHLVSLRIGFEMSRQHLSSVLRRFFKSFERALADESQVDSTTQVASHILDSKHNQLSSCSAGNVNLLQGCDERRDVNEGSPAQENRGGMSVGANFISQVPASPPIDGATCCEDVQRRSMSEVRAVFDADLAHMTYLPFCKQIGGVYMAESILGADNCIIQKLCLRDDSTLNISPGTTEAKSAHRRNISHGQEESFVSSEFGKNIAILGNRIDVQCTEQNSSLSDGRAPLPPEQLGGPASLASSTEYPLPTRQTDVSQLSGTVPNVALTSLSEFTASVEQPISTSPAVLPKRASAATAAPAGHGPLSIGRYDMNLLRRKMANTQRHLKGNWLSYWEHEIGLDPTKVSTSLDFKQIRLQTFVGHTGGVRALVALDNENSFLSASKDKTVRLWSLRNASGVSQPGSVSVDGASGSSNSGSSVDGAASWAQWTYTLHRKPVFAVHFLDSQRVVGSCDGSVHVWDPFLGSAVRTLDQTRYAPVTAFSVLSAPSSCFLAATVHGLIKVLDARCAEYQHDFKTSVGASGTIRCIAPDPDNSWVAIGHSSGVVSVLDLRSGIVMGTWTAHEGEILQVKALGGGLFVTSGLDQTVSVWSAGEAKLKCHLKGVVDPTICIARYQRSVVTGTTSNRVTIHSSMNDVGFAFQQQHAASVKLRADTFRGMLSSLAVLPLNRLLLLGSDNGTISLYC